METCAEKTEYSLNHPVVQAVRKKWMKCKKKKVDVSFERLFELFKTDCIRIAEIARRIGVSRQATQYIYNSYFRELFGSKSGKKRSQICKLSTISRLESKFSACEITAIIAEKARSAGLEVKKVPSIVRSTVRGTLHRRLRINSLLCVLHKSTRAVKQGKETQSSRFNIGKLTLDKTDISIFFCQAKGFSERVFIIPNKALLEASLCWQNDKGTCMLYAPLEKRLLRKSKIDWWKYENAWDLFTPQQLSPVPPDAISAP